MMRLRVGENLLYLALRAMNALRPRRADAAELGTPAIRRILAVSNTAIGDTLMSTPGLRSLRLAYPDAHIALMIDGAYRELFASNPDADEVIDGRGDWRGFWPRVLDLRRRRFDLVCIFHSNEPQATPMCWLSGARFVFKLPNTNRFRFLLSNPGPVLKWDDFAHGIDQRLAVAALAGGKPTDRRMTLPIGAEQRDDLGQWLRERDVPLGAAIVGFQPGASTHSRRWAPSRFVDLGRRLLARHPELRIVITGSPAEKALADAIARGIGDPRVLPTAGELPLRLLPALLERCAPLVTGDTGPMHLAVAAGTPVVALFAVADWRRSGPAYDLDRHVVIQRGRTCDPCYSKNCPYDEPICMEQIAVDDVQAAVQDVLARGTP
ncbi:MAG TPA: glycosyltransferase family 9 protein [Rhodocyclaceae bacterium]